MGHKYIRGCDCPSVGVSLTLLLGGQRLVNEWKESHVLMFGLDFQCLDDITMSPNIVTCTNA